MIHVHVIYQFVCINEKTSNDNKRRLVIKKRQKMISEAMSHKKRQIMMSEAMSHKKRQKIISEAMSHKNVK